jgi:hypothetical protein
MTLIHDSDNRAMETISTGCEHRWRYFVNVASKAVRVRECESCHRRAIIPVHLGPLPRQPRTDPERLTA